MPDREKTIRSIEEAIQYFSRYSGDEYGREFDYARVEVETLEDALALLKAQEPRVMTIGDLYGQDMGYYERKDEELVWPVLITRGGPDEDGTVGIVRKDAFEIKADCGLMNITWRIWTEYPTIVQREATPWEP